MTELKFRGICLEDREAVEKILREEDSFSCQFSFPNLWCLREKYGTELCIQGNTLYLRQTLRRRNGSMAYFPPIGGEAGALQMKRILEHAERESGTLFLFGITQERKALTEACLPGQYRVSAERDWFEYLYEAGRLRDFSGSGLAHRRRDMRAFWRQYGGRAAVEPIGENNLEEVAAFQRRWQAENLGRNGEPGQLAAEHSSILNGLEHFKELGLCGILIRVGGNVAGYGYGAGVGRNTYDIMVQKADYRFRNLNQALLREIAVCRPEAAYINYEEDIGLAGLRQAKLSYKPDILLEKFCALSQGGAYE